MPFVERIAAWLRDKRIFRRERTPTDKRALGIALYAGGLSYEKSGEAVGVSRQAVKDWFDRAAEYFRRLRRRRRRRVAMDEKVIHLPDGDAYLWAAVDLDTGEVTALLVSRGRSGLEALAFLEKVRRKCAGRLPRVFIDGGEWYPWALRQAGFDRWTVVAFGPRSAIERYFSLVDHRYRRFWERFPFRSTVESVLRWSEAFGGVHNMRRSLS